MGAPLPIGINLYLIFAGVHVPELFVRVTAIPRDDGYHILKSGCKFIPTIVRYVTGDLLVQNLGERTSGMFGCHSAPTPLVGQHKSLSIES